MQACKMIEIKGFLPDKVFQKSVHDGIVSVAQLLNIDVNYYCKWLEMRSVTFTQEANAAVQHMVNGNAGGQGLKNMSTVLQEIVKRGNDHQKHMASGLIEQIEAIRLSPAVVYAVDLSGLGQRLVKDLYQPLYQVYWNPDIPLPEVSEIAPSHLIERLSIH